MEKWDDRFMRIADEVASWSKDPGTKVGAVLVRDRRILATGFNGFAQGIADTDERYLDRPTKLALTVHAEINALLSAGKNGAQTKGSTLYVTFPPCVNCCSAVIQAGVKRVVCPAIETTPERWHESFTRGALLLGEAGITQTLYYSNSWTSATSNSSEKNAPSVGLSG